MFAGTSVVLGSIPDFLVGVGLVYVFAVTLAWLPVAGNDTLSSYILPVVALALGTSAVLARIVRVETLAVLETDYIRTARAKRLPALRINLVHALPNAVTATLTIGGLLLSSLIAGTVLVENVFAWPGLGSTIVVVDRLQGLSRRAGDRPRVRRAGAGHQHARRRGHRGPRPALDDRRLMSARRWGRAMRTPVGLVGLTLLTIVVLLAVFAPILWHGRADAVDTSNILAGPSREHWLGTDALGRDLFYRVLVATRLTVLLAVSATVIATVIGLLLGAAPLLLGRRVGSFVGALINIMVAFPGLLLVLFFAVVFGVGAKGAVLAIGLAGAPFFGRLCQTLMAGITSRDFVAAARIAGVGRFRILLRHVLPNIAEPLVVNVTIGAGAALLAFAGLSFLGLGVQPPAYDWGQLMQRRPLRDLRPSRGGPGPGRRGDPRGARLQPHRRGDRPRLRRPGDRKRPARARDRPRRARAAGQRSTSRDTDDDPDVVLDVRELRVTFPGAAGPIRPVRGISFRVRSGQAVGLVGESGSGKSLTALAVSQLVEEPGRVEADRLSFVGTDLLDGKPDQTLLGQSLVGRLPGPDDHVQPRAPDGAPARRGRPASIRVWDVAPRSPVPSTACAR